MLNRRSFCQLVTAACFSAPGLLRAQSAKNVLVIGAGAAGLTAAFHLKSAGVNVRVLEASGHWGGRIKRDTKLASVPLDLGAEWIHNDPNILGEIVGQGRTDLGISTIDYTPQTYQFWHKDKLKSWNVLRHAYSEVKFFDTTWYGFFERFVLPEVDSSIIANTPVTEIKSDGPLVRVASRTGQTFEADKVLVTVPLSVMNRGALKFNGAFNKSRLKSLKDVQFGSGFKVFCTFKERFYPDLLMFGSRLSALGDTWSEKIYYDAAFGKPTSENILGLFTVSDAPLPRAKLSDSAMIQSVRDELAMIFGEETKQAFIAARVQNWSTTPFINGSYSMDNLSERDITDILAPIEGRVFFAGEALGGNSQSTVHGAAFSAKAAVESLLQS